MAGIEPWTKNLEDQTVFWQKALTKESLAGECCCFTQDPPPLSRVAVQRKRSQAPEGLQGHPLCSIGRITVQRQISWAESMPHDWNMIYTVAGAASITVSEARFSIAKGDVFLIRPGCPRIYCIGSKPGFWEIATVHFLPLAHWQLKLSWLEVAPGFMRVNVPTPELRDELFVTFDKLLQMSRVPTSYGQQIAMNLLENALLRCEALHHADQSAETDPRITRAKAYIEEQLREPFSLHKLAQGCGLSKTRLCVLFRAQLRRSPRAYWERCRLSRAEHLLATTTMSVAEIGRQVGFEDPFYFSQRFKKELGDSPRAYRQRIHFSSV